MDKLLAFQEHYSGFIIFIFFVLLILAISLLSKRTIKKLERDAQQLHALLLETIEVKLSNSTEVSREEYAEIINNFALPYFEHEYHLSLCRPYCDESHSDSIKRYKENGVVEALRLITIARLNCASSEKELDDFYNLICYGKPCDTVEQEKLLSVLIQGGLGNMYFFARKNGHLIQV